MILIRFYGSSGSDFVMVKPPGAGPGPGPKGGMNGNGNNGNGGGQNPNPNPNPKQGQGSFPPPYDAALAGYLGSFAGAAIRELNTPGGAGKGQQGTAKAPKPASDPNCTIQ